MKATTSESNPSTILKLLKGNGKILYPHLIAQPPRSLAQVTADTVGPM